MPPAEDAPRALGELLRAAGLSAPAGLAQAGVTGLTCDSRAVRPGMLFVAVRGFSVDGHRFVADAVRAGAVAAVVEAAAGDVAAPQVVAGDSRRALAQLAQAWHGQPADGLRAYGVTGTNGKTTTTFLLRSVLEAAGGRPAVLGTTGYHFPEGAQEAPHTTPEAPELWALLAEARRQRCDAVVMEVSSHALKLRRTYGLPFDAVAFTNLTRDHLDFHPDFGDYRESKMRLFEPWEAEPWRKPRAASLNLDDPEGARFAARAKTAPTWTFSRLPAAAADVSALRETLGPDGSAFSLRWPGGEFAVELKLAGPYNVSNALTAASLALQTGVPAEAVRRGLESVRGVPGRLEAVRHGQPFAVWVDYAHTPDALERVLQAAREAVAGRLICVFGCGGDRDPGKRAPMGAVATRLADFTVVTSDNPRTEDPAKILEDIRPGLSADSLRWVMDVDRRRAIGRALSAARPRDGVVIAGKGHEDYQIVGTVKHPFDDRQVAREALTALGHRP
ncbi:MAG: UDP-N-acetylmuramoyl-L-alanyl-D-glutamate--2,6-diaminopimelate ligase [Candidatus Eisenbacteria bacterium]|nr:UDP-N-acetylmuramoyl-L-alanyl-D-glutamate--2,6-diaminopimelate ligase [Candidatus Eisenbacteria bacterium]